MSACVLRAEALSPCEWGSQAYVLQQGFGEVSSGESDYLKKDLKTVMLEFSNQSVRSDRSM